jgi:hypothetical protein
MMRAIPWYMERPRKRRRRDNIDDKLKTKINERMRMWKRRRRC